MVRSVGEPAPAGHLETAALRGWRTEGQSSRLVLGMPHVTSTGLKGERSLSGAELKADNLGLDEEMLRVTE